MVVVGAEVKRMSCRQRQYEYLFFFQKHGKLFQYFNISEVFIIVGQITATSSVKVATPPQGVCLFLWFNMFQASSAAQKLIVTGWFRV